MALRAARSGVRQAIDDVFAIDDVRSLVSRTSRRSRRADPGPSPSRKILSRCAAGFVLDPGSRDGAARHGVRRAIDDVPRIDDVVAQR